MNIGLGMQLAMRLMSLTPDGVNSNGNLTVTVDTLLSEVAQWVAEGDDDDEERTKVAYECVRFLNRQPE